MIDLFAADGDYRPLAAADLPHDVAEAVRDGISTDYDRSLIGHLCSHPVEISNLWLTPDERGEPRVVFRRARRPRRGG